MVGSSETATSETATGAPAAALCRHFSARGWCMYGETCRFQHVVQSTSSTEAEAEAEAEAAAAAGDAAAAADAAFREAIATVNTLRRTGAPRADLLAAVAELKALQARYHETLAHKPKSRFATRRKLHNCERHSIFRQFLCDTYGIEGLSAGEGVLDVAGGHGLLAFELANVARVPVTVVDPRPLNMARMERKWRLGALLAHGDVGEPPLPDAPEAAHRAYASRMAHRAVYEARTRHGERFERPQHWRHTWEPRLFERVAAIGGATPSAYDVARLGEVAAELREAAAHMAWTSKGLVPATTSVSDRPKARGESPGAGGAGAAGSTARGEGPCESSAAAVGASGERATLGRNGGGAADGPDDGDDDEDDEDDAITAEVPDAAAAWRRLAECSAIVGMHPDGATEAIVDFALATNRPFAVVPCCTYSTLNPHLRNTRNSAGERVTEYRAFVRYLAEKGPGRIGVKKLPFEGKNLVVYSLPLAPSGAPQCAECEP